VDVVHGHSSHHPRPVEVYRDRLVLYGCGDLINDYEGIGGRDEFRGELRLLYLVTLDAGSHALRKLRLVPMRARRLRLERARTFIGTDSPLFGDLRTMLRETRPDTVIVCSRDSDHDTHIVTRLESHACGLLGVEADLNDRPARRWELLLGDVRRGKDRARRDG
jgi:hypothetical protein